MKVKEILNEAYDRDSQKQIYYEKTDEVYHEYIGIAKQWYGYRVVSLSDAADRLLNLADIIASDAEMYLSQAKEARDRQIAAERIIDTLEKPRWKQVLTLRYIAQMGWSEIADTMHTTDDAVRAIHARAVALLEAQEEL